ncbi:probable protein phosphatase 2C 26 isoform X1 [Ananas comosus]|uniref:protein-serine/threonine phosphatase n=1 Tax=Ananas comosus TaxID=4615 RepID=A0A6P5ELP7_ANACO|nr:probable protein phosphatase 2C 26 isoform X1 [Ananas comosus]
MGSGASRLFSCVRPSGGGVGGGDGAAAGFDPGPLDETLGHSFCYVRSSSPAHSRSSSASSCTGGGGGGGGGGGSAAVETAFKTISGASVSANSSATLPVYGSGASAAASSGFRSSSSFSALPLQLAAASGPLDRGFFLSGPIERGALSGPLDQVPFSGPIVKKKRRGLPRRLRKPSLFGRSLSEKNRPWVVPLRSFNGRKGDLPDAAAADCSAAAEGSVQWAHGKAGEDRVHIVVSEEHRWLFVGIYDGFNGPEAPDFLVANLYRSVFDELRGLFWAEDEEEPLPQESSFEKDERRTRGSVLEDSRVVSKPLWQFLADGDGDAELDFSGSGRFAFSLSKLRYGIGSWRKDGRKVRLPRWIYASDDKAKESSRVVADRGSSGGSRRRKAAPAVADHGLVLGALARALETTELAFLEMTDRAMDCNPEMALMGSCLLVALMRDDDVYVMNVGDSRAIVAQRRDWGSVDRQMDDGGFGCNDGGRNCDVEIDEASRREATELGALQLSTDHSTSIKEEVLRIKREHPDDDQCIVNERVKGRLKVTRAFGAGYLKQPKWNDGLLEMFRNEFVGTAPYITCTPSLRHYKLRPNDQFLVLSSDGLYQYLSNKEVVLHVENFMERFPDGDPAQSLIEELLFRAAQKAGMDFFELLDIPQGDRRKYHDDVTVMVISLEGRIWKSSGKYV